MIVNDLYPCILFLMKLYPCILIDELHKWILLDEILVFFVVLEKHEYKLS
jgi:hypothetical protein